MKRYLAVFAIALCVLLSGCATNESKADRLFDEGSYREALELYESLEPSDEISLKEADCRFWLFVEYAREKGGVTKDYPGKNYKVSVEARQDGNLKCRYESDLSVSSSGMLVELDLSISYHQAEAELQGRANTNIGYASLGEKGTGVLDLGTYSLGSQVKWDDYSASGMRIDGHATTSGKGLISDNSSDVRSLVSGIKDILIESGTSATLSDLGFEKC